MVHTSTLLCYLLYGVFALRSSFVVRLDSDLTIHDGLGIFGGFGLGIYIGWEDSVYFSWEFSGELGASDELDAWTR